MNRVEREVVELALSVVKEHADRESRENMGVCSPRTGRAHYGLKYMLQGEPIRECPEAARHSRTGGLCWFDGGSPARCRVCGQVGNPSGSEGRT